MKNNFQHTEILERISDAFVALDKNWCYTYMNKKAGEIFNRNPQDMIGKHIWTEFPEGIGQPFYKEYYRAMADQKYIYLEEYYPPSNKWFENHIYPSPEGLSIYFRDITEKKKEEEIIKKSITELSNYKLALNESSLVSITDHKGIINYVSDSFCKITQYNSDELLSKNHSIISSGFHSKDFFKEMWSTISKGKIWKGEIKDKTKDGNFIWLDTTIVPFMNETGQPFQFVAIRKDITDRKITENELIETIFSLSETQRISKIGNWTYFMNGELKWSENLYQLYGLPTKITSTTPEFFFELVYPDDREKMQKWMMALLAGETPGEYEFRSILPDGSLHYFGGSGEFKYDKENNPIYLRGTVQDITERKKSEEKIIESELNYRSLFEQASDAIFITGTDFNYIDINTSGHYIDINTCGCKLTGYSKDEFIKLTPNDLVFKEDMKANPFKTDQLKSGKTFSYERRLKRKDGTAVVVEANTKFLLDGRVVIFVRDITERKKAEQEILQKNTELKELTEHLQKIREEERKEIALEVHDELGQQLAAIKIDAKWLNKRVVNDVNIKNKTEEMLLLIDETIKTTRKISSELRPEILDELGLMAAIEWKAEKFCNRTGIKCKLQIDCDELVLPSDVSINIFRIIQESLINIAKHSESTKVNIHLKVENKNLIILISDNGKGFDSEKIKQKKSFGLIGMKERAEMIGGTIQIVSEQGKGTLVELIVPIG